MATRRWFDIFRGKALKIAGSLAGTLVGLFLVLTLLFNATILSTDVHCTTDVTHPFYVNLFGELEYGELCTVPILVKIPKGENYDYFDMYSSGGSFEFSPNVGYSALYIKDNRCSSTKTTPHIGYCPINFSEKRREDKQYNFRWVAGKDYEFLLDVKKVDVDDVLKWTMFASSGGELDPYVYSPFVEDATVYEDGIYFNFSSENKTILEIDIALDKWNGSDFLNPSVGLVVNYSDNVYKLVATDFFQEGLGLYRYRVNSSLEIQQIDDYTFRVYTGYRDVYNGEETKTEKYVSQCIVPNEYTNCVFVNEGTLDEYEVCEELTVDCIKEREVNSPTYSTVSQYREIDFSVDCGKEYANCSFILSNDSKTLINEFISDGNIDPTISYSDSVFASSSVLNDVRLEPANYTHLATSNNEPFNNMVAYWNFDYNSRWKSGVISESLFFDGRDGYVNLDSGINNELENTNFTISFWVKSAGTQNSFTGYVTDTSADILIRNKVGSQELQFGVNENFYNSELVPPVGEWVNYVMTFSTSNGINVYADGVLNGTTDYYTPANAISSMQIGRDSTAIDRVVHGSMDEVMFFNRELDSTEVGELYTNNSLGNTAFEGDANLISYYTFNTTFTDSKNGYDGKWAGEGFDTVYDETNNDNDGSLVGEAILDGGLYGGGLILDGVGDYAETTIAGDKNSTSFWIKNVTDTDWSHIAFNGTKYFLNGVVSSIDSYPLNISGDNIRIGINKTEYFNGSIDDVMIFNVSLNSSQILDIYNNQSSRYKQKGSQEFKFIDLNDTYNKLNISINSESYLDASVNGSVGQWKGSFGYNDEDLGDSLFYSASEDFFTMNLDPDNYSGYFSISAWVKIDDCQTGDRHFYKWSETGTWGGVYWNHDCSDGGNNVRFGSGTSATATSFTNNMQDGKWHLITAVNNDSDLNKFYIDGELQTTTPTGAGLVNNAATAQVGGSLSWGAYYTYSDEYIFYNKSLTQKDVTQIYLNGRDGYVDTSDVISWYSFKPKDDSTTAYDNMGRDNATYSLGAVNVYDYNNLVAYYHADGNAEDSSGNGFNGSLLGNANATSTGMFNSSFGFDGNGDHVTIPYNESFNMANKNITICAWQRPTTQASYRGVVMQKATRKWGLWNNGVNTYVIINNGLRASIPIEINNWTHICGNYETGVGSKIYKNGDLADTDTAYTTAIAADTNGVEIGSIDGTNYWYGGNIDEVMIFDRVLSDSEVREIYVKGRAKFNFTEEQPILDTAVTFDVDDSSELLLPKVNLFAGTNQFSSPFLTEATFDYYIGATGPTDNEYPQFSNNWDNNASLTDSGTGLFNITITSTNGTAYLDIDGVNETGLNWTGNIYNATHVFSSTGTFTYRWCSWGNGTNSNFNCSVDYYYTVNSSVVAICDINLIAAEIWKYSDGKFIDGMYTQECTSTPQNATNGKVIWEYSGDVGRYVDGIGYAAEVSTVADGSLIHNCNITDVALSMWCYDGIRSINGIGSDSSINVSDTGNYIWNFLKEFRGVTEISY